MKSLLCAKSEMLRLNLKSWSLQFARIPQPCWAREWSGKWRRKSGRWKVADKPGQKQLLSTTKSSWHVGVKINLQSFEDAIIAASRVSFGSQVWPSELLPYQVVLILRFSQYQPCPNGLESRVTIAVSFQRHCFPFLALFLC